MTRQRKRSAWDSPHWIKYSRRMRRWHPWCSIKAHGCEGNDHLQVHHLHYPPKPLPLWMVGPWNLIVACRSCHAQITQQHRGKSGDDRYVLATIAVMGSVRFKVWRWISGTFWFIVLGLPASFLMALAIAAVVTHGDSMTH